MNGAGVGVTISVVRPKVEGAGGKRDGDVFALLLVRVMGFWAGPGRRRSVIGWGSESEKLPGDRFKGTLGGDMVSVLRREAVLSAACLVTV